METLQRALLLCVVAALAPSTVRAIVDEDLNRRCQAQETCTECIGESPDCGWCSEMDIASDERRCNAIDRDDPGANNCSIPLEDPVSVLINRVDVMLEGLTQVTPQRANVRVRPGSPVTFEVSVKPANNFPIDLYLLMDLSASMSDDLENLKTLGRLLAERIAVISNNFTLGFGSFVDKRRGSFVNLSPPRLIDPCNGGCESPYSFRHVVTLAENNGVQFAERVNEQIISGNQDFPEGGFDGFMQAIVCTNVIGWRPVSRKILLYISDAGFHFAGDGLLGGVIEPNDGMCHMGSDESTLNPDGTREYNAWDRLDFPSIGQIAEKLDEFDIIPILAVVEQFQDLYALLQAELGNRAFLGELDTDSSNVVDLVEDLYNEISTSVAFSPVNIPGVSITTTITICPVPRLGVCTDVMSGQTVTFNVIVDVTECTEELLSGPREIQLRVLGFGTVTVELNAICDCSCDTLREDNSTECTDRGTRVCGICECNPGFFGDTCQCDSSGATTDGQSNIIMCPVGLGDLQCSGRGTCTCGICECRRDSNGNERFYGPACECDITICERGIGNEICSGSSNGECTCDGCRCLPEPVTGLPYTMSDCSCTPNTQTCIDPTNTTDICNGRGVCECGQCICDPDSPYFGDYCDECSTGSPICRLQLCAADSDNTLCASCVVDLLEVLNALGVNDSLFTAEIFAEALRNGTLPEGSNLTTVSYGDQTMMMTVAAIMLPPVFSSNCSSSVNVTCPQFYIVNETQEMEYEIQDVLSQRCTLQVDCIYPYYVSIDRLGNRLPIHVGYPPACPVLGARGGSGAQLDIPAWAIALILIAILFVLGILALILLKILLMVFDYIELKKFESELEKIKYTKNENPLYHAATTEHKNPIYGQ